MSQNQIIQIPKGSSWLLVEVPTNTTKSVQNISGVLIEYSYNNSSELGLIIPPYKTVNNISKDFYIRVHDKDSQNTPIMITTNIATPHAFPNKLISLEEQGSVTLDIGDFANIVTFRAKLDSGDTVSKLTGFRFSVDIPSGSNLYGEVMFQLVGVVSTTGTPNFQDIAPDSEIEYDHTNNIGSALNIVDSKSVLTESVSYVSVKNGGNVSDISVDADQLGAVATAGNMFAIVAKNYGNAEVKVRAVLNWLELL